MDAPAWSAQLLAEFVAAVSTAETGTAAAHAAVERAAEALDADVAAIVCGGELVAAVGYPQGSALVAELAAVRPGVADAWLQVPGAGSCAAAAATLEYPPGATLVLARSGPRGLSREETGLLRGMARVAAMTMRMLDVLDQERSAREEAGGSLASRPHCAGWRRSSRAQRRRLRCSRQSPRRWAVSFLPNPRRWPGTTRTALWRSARGAGPASQIPRGAACHAAVRM